MERTRPRECGNSEIIIKITNGQPHQELTLLGASLAMKALNSPEFFMV